MRLCSSRGFRAAVRATTDRTVMLEVAVSGASNGSLAVSGSVVCDVMVSGAAAAASGAAESFASANRSCGPCAGAAGATGAAAGAADTSASRTLSGPFSTTDLTMTTCPACRPYQGCWASAGYGSPSYRGCCGCCSLPSCCCWCRVRCAVAAVMVRHDRMSRESRVAMILRCRGACDVIVAAAAGDANMGSVRANLVTGQNRHRFRYRCPCRCRCRNGDSTWPLKSNPSCW